MNCELCDHHNSTKNITVIHKVMPVGLAKDSPLLEPFVDGLLSLPHDCHHPLPLSWAGDTLWAYDLGRCFVNVSVIGLDTFKRIQIGPERLAEDLDVGHLPGHVWAAEPADVSALDSHCDFIADGRLLELV